MRLASILRPLVVAAAVALGGVAVSGCGSTDSAVGPVVYLGDTKAYNLITTPSFSRGAGGWAVFADKTGGGGPTSKVKGRGKDATLTLERGETTEPTGFVQRFMDVPLKKGDVYKFAVTAQAKDLKAPEDNPVNVARAAIAPVKQWYALDNVLDFTRVSGRKTQELSFEVPRSGTYRVSLILERSPGTFEISRVYLSEAVGDYFDGDTPGARWTGEPGRSTSLYDPAQARKVER